MGDKEKPKNPHVRPCTRKPRNEAILPRSRSGRRWGRGGQDHFISLDSLLLVIVCNSCVSNSREGKKLKKMKGTRGSVSQHT